jgi:hypothetical protein
MRTVARPQGVSDKAGHPVLLVQAIIKTLLISAAWRPIIALLTGSPISLLMDNNSPSQNHKHTLELSGFSVHHRYREADTDDPRRELLQCLGLVENNLHYDKEEGASL